MQITGIPEQWDLDLTNLYITKSTIFSKLVAKYMERNLDITAI